MSIDNKEMNRNSDNNTRNNGESVYKYSGRNRIYNDGKGRNVYRTKVRMAKLLDVVMVTIPFLVAW